MIRVQNAFQLLLIGIALFSGLIPATSSQDRVISAVVKPQKDLTLHKQVCVDESACPSLSTGFVSTSKKKLGGADANLRFQLAQAVIGNVITDEIWSYESTAPYQLCDRSGCKTVGRVKTTARITLNGRVQRVEMTAQVIEGPRIKPILYRRCVDTNGALPVNTTCGEDSRTADDYLDSTDIYKVTTNYEAEDPGPYYYAFRWSWYVEGFGNTPARTGRGRSATFACEGDFCKFQ